MMDCLMVGLGGFVGSVCRYLISRVPLGSGSGFPVNTFVINIAGAFAIGCIASAAGRGPGRAAAAVFEGGHMRGLYHIFHLFPGDCQAGGGRTVDDGGALCGGQRRAWRPGGIYGPVPDALRS